MKIIIIITINYLWKIFHENNIAMLYYDRIGLSEGIDVDKTSTSRYCIICHHCYFYIEGISFNRLSTISVMMY